MTTVAICTFGNGQFIINPVYSNGEMLGAFSTEITPSPVIRVTTTLTAGRVMT
jgi:hypothetical protein